MLPTCPACKQSVLDDDATECPFCGANMKTGKPGGGKPAAAPKAAAPKASAASAAGRSSKPAAGAGKPSSGSSRKSILDEDDDDPFAEKEDDDPFAAATREAAASKANAILVSAKKTKTHVVELKCPMCDTVGFVPEKSGGKDVKCCNPKCTVPVFMAPKNLAPPAPVVAPKPVKGPSKPSKKPLILAIVGGVGLVGVVALVVLFWPVDKPKEFVFPVNPDGPKLPVIATDGATDTGNQKLEEPEAVPAAEQLDIPALLRLMQDRSLEEVLVNKKYCRQRTAIAFAVTGNVEGMNTEFQRLDEIEATLQHFKIPAYLVTGWNQLSKGDKAGAAATADAAIAATANIGKGSRETQEAVIDLTAFLIANGRADAARKVLADSLKSDASTPLVVTIALAKHRRDFDVEWELPGSIGNPQPAWPEVGVTLILTTQGFWAEAEQWAESIPAVQAKTDCLVAWADAKLHDAITKKQPVDTAVEGVAAKLTPGGKVQLLARLGLTQAKAENAAEAGRLIAAAQEALKSITVPAIVHCDGFKEALDWKVPAEAVALRQAALGANAIGLALAQTKKFDEGWVAMAEALKYTRGLAPSPAAVAAVKAAGEDLGTEGLRDKVRMLLNLRARDEAVRKTRELLNKLDELEALAATRFQLQEAIMVNAVNAGMAKLVWTDALSLSQRTDPNEKELYLSGTLPALLLNRFNKDGSAAEAAEVTEKVEKVATDEVYDLQQIVDAALQGNNFAEAIAAFNQIKLVGGTEEVALRGFIRAAKREGQALLTLALADSLDAKTNKIVKLEVLRTVAAFAAVNGDPVAVKSSIQNQKLSALEKISGNLGLIEGDVARPKPPAPTADPDQAKPATKAAT